MLGNTQVTQTATTDDEEYTGVINADLEHNESCPFCGDMKCCCHEDKEAIARTAEYVQEGLMSVADADRLFHGGTI